MIAPFDLQGHRGARGLRPENTLSSFEAALDAGVTSIETDLHRTRDGIVVLCHDALVAGPAWELPGGEPVGEGVAVSRLTLDELRRYRVGRNPARFPDQEALVPPLSRRFAGRHGFDPGAVPTLADLFAFARAYAGDMGAEAGKAAWQRATAGRVRVDLELKRIPFYPLAIDDGYTGSAAGDFEGRVLEVVRTAGMVERTAVRSFDHRCVRLLRELEPGLTGAVLLAGTAPVDPADLVRRASGAVYCPDYEFLDEDLVRRAHAGGVRVVPWTVNDPAHWQRLLDWGVDGLTTDYPDRLARFLQERGIAF